MMRKHARHPAGAQVPVLIFELTFADLACDARRPRIDKASRADWWTVAVFCQMGDEREEPPPEIGYLAMPKALPNTLQPRNWREIRLSLSLASLHSAFSCHR